MTPDVGEVAMIVVSRATCDAEVPKCQGPGDVGDFDLVRPHHAGTERCGEGISPTSRAHPRDDDDSAPHYSQRTFEGTKACPAREGLSKTY